MADHDNRKNHDHKHEPGRSMVALFQSRAEGRSAISALHKAKYTHTWLGATSVAETAGGNEAVTVEKGGFFSGTESLVEALVSKGVLGDEARAIEGRVESGNVVVSVDPKDRALDEAARIIEQHGGRLGGKLMGEGAWGAWPTSAADATDLNGDDAFEEMLFERRL